MMAQAIGITPRGISALPARRHDARCMPRRNTIVGKTCKHIFIIEYTIVTTLHHLNKAISPYSKLSTPFMNWTADSFTPLLFKTLFYHRSSQLI
jgi:hypothetical protein